MINAKDFAYTAPQWEKIKCFVREELDCDADQIEHHGEPLRFCIEIAASVYLPQSAINRQRLSREQLKVLRKDAENLRTRVSGSIVVRIAINNVVEPYRHEGVDDDMLSSTDRYFTKLLDNLDRMIEKAGSRRDNARKSDRDGFWNQLLRIWCDIGGEPTGKAAARFLVAASEPVCRAVPDINSVVQWLERRQPKVLRRAVR